MWLAHHTAVSQHWLLIQKRCSRNSVSVHNARTTFALPPNMAAVRGNRVRLNYSRMSLACPKQDSINVPLSSTMYSRESHWRFRSRLGGNHEARLKASLDSAPNDGTEVCEDKDEDEDDGKELEVVAANALEFTHTVALDVLAPLDLVWTFWTDIKSAPLWMRWIDRVDFLEDDEMIDDSLVEDLPPGLSRLSRWICSTIGFEVMWVARVEHVESNLPVRVLRWATVEGLPSRGEVTFKENTTKGTTVELSISHSLPAALGRVMQSSALKGLVRATLQTDLECFQKYAAEAVNQKLECVTAEKDRITERKGSLTITTDCSQNLCDPL